MSKRLITKAWKVARNYWKINVLYERGRRFAVPESLSKYIVETLAIVYLEGFKAGERSAKRKVK